MEFENVAVKPLVQNDVPTYYYIYVHETLVFIKKDQIQHDLNILNSFLKKLQLTLDTFDQCNIHFLDIKILNDDETDIFIKGTNTGTYIKEKRYDY